MPSKYQHSPLPLTSSPSGLVLPSRLYTSTLSASDSSSAVGGLRGPIVSEDSAAEADIAYSSLLMVGLSLASMMFGNALFTGGDNAIMLTMTMTGATAAWRCANGKASADMT
jgi:hypothetical protein